MTTTEQHPRPKRPARKAVVRDRTPSPVEEDEDKDSPEEAHVSGDEDHALPSASSVPAADAPDTPDDALASSASPDEVDEPTLSSQATCSKRGKRKRKPP